MKARRVLIAALATLFVALAVGGVLAWSRYRSSRADYDHYRTLIQAGTKVAGVDVGWRTPTQASEQVMEAVAEPYYREFSLHYEDDAVELSPKADLGFAIPVDDMVAQAVEASHRYDYWEGFWLWLRGEVVPLDLDVELEMAFRDEAAADFLGGVAEAYDIVPSEPMVDTQSLLFIPGRSGRRLKIDAGAEMINESVPQPMERDVVLPVEVVEPNQSSARIEGMLRTLAPVMERPPVPASFFTDTLPLSTTGGIAGTPTVSYTGHLTWTYPHFADYTGHLTQTTGFFFDPGKAGYTFDLQSASNEVEIALEQGITTPIGFEPELVPQPPITADLLLPPLQDRLDRFPGVSSIFIKNLDTAAVVYESNADYVLSGMSIVKIGIMVDVYRHYGGEIDEETRQELLDMLGSESCNPCANRLLATLGGGSANTGASKVTNTMRHLGLENFYLCAPFRIVGLWQGDAATIWAANSSQWLAERPTPGYDRCVRATPREMATLVEMIDDCTEGGGGLVSAYPDVFNPEVCKDMIGIMASNDLRNMLGAGIPKEVTLAHKHGFSGYDVPWGDTRGEVGIVYSPGARWLISFYIWQDTDWINWGINQPLYRDVSNMLYNYFNPAAPHWPLPPWAEPPEEEEEKDT